MQPRRGLPRAVQVLVGAAQDAREENAAVHRVQWLLQEAAPPAATDPAAIGLADPGGDPDVALCTLATVLATDAPAQRQQDRVATLAAAATGMEHASVVVLDPARLVAVGHTAHVPAALGQAQLAVGEGPTLVGEGPTLDALAAGQTRLTGDLTADPRWPRLARQAPATPGLAVLAVPMHLPGSPYGVLTLSRSRPAPIDVRTLRRSAAVSRIAAAVLANTAVYTQAAQHARQLTEAMESRAVIEQAVGVVIADRHLPAEAAFDLLRRRSQHQHRKLCHLAAEIVQTASHPPANTPPRHSQA